jgi:hypothetical protein
MSRLKRLVFGLLIRRSESSIVGEKGKPAVRSDSPLSKRGQNVFTDPDVGLINQNNWSSQEKNKSIFIGIPLKSLPYLDQHINMVLSARLSAVLEFACLCRILPLPDARLGLAVQRYRFGELQIRSDAGGL